MTTIMQDEAKKMRDVWEKSIKKGGTYSVPLPELVLLSATLDTIEDENRRTNKKMLYSLICAFICIIIGLIQLIL